MLALLAGSAGSSTDSVRTKAILYVIAGTAIIVLISLLLDIVKRYIRGLDIAALGALLFWLGHEAAKSEISQAYAPYLYAVGGTLVVTGLIAFILIKIIRHKRNVKKKMAMERETVMQQREQALREKEAQKAAEAAAETAPSE